MLRVQMIMAGASLQDIERKEKTATEKTKQEKQVALDKTITVFKESQVEKIEIQTLSKELQDKSQMLWATLHMSDMS